MKRLSRMTVLIITLLVISLTACGSRFNGSRRGNSRELTMDYKIFNMTYSQDFTVDPGETIKAVITVKRGSLAIKIQKDNEEPVYQNDNFSKSGEFDVEIQEGGIYTVTLTGRNTKGRVSFTVENGRE